MGLSLSFNLLMFLLPHFVMAMGGIPSVPKQVPELLAEADDLSFNHYARTCPNFEAVVHKKVKEWIAKDYTLAASLIRLHFHDCAVRVHRLDSLSLSLSRIYDGHDRKCLKLWPFISGLRCISLTKPPGKREVGEGKPDSERIQRDRWHQGRAWEEVPQDCLMRRYTHSSCQGCHCQG